MRRTASMKIRSGTCMLIHTIMIVYKQIRTDSFISFHLEYENGPVSQKRSCDITSYVLNDTGKNLDMLDIRLFLNSRLYQSMLVFLKKKRAVSLQQDIVVRFHRIRNDKTEI